jgi:FkbM family methyltransferase
MRLIPLAHGGHKQYRMQTLHHCMATPCARELGGNMADGWVTIDVTIGDFFCDFSMHDCSGRDQVVSAIRRAGWKGYEPPLPLIIARHIRHRRGLFIDVGANTGYYSLLAASLGADRVVAFEPVPFIRDIFQKNRNQSNLTEQIEISACALGEKPGRFNLYMPDNGHGLIETSASLNMNFRTNHSGQFDVEVTTLDDFFQCRPEPRNDPIFLKIDVESLEEQVLRGGENILQFQRPIIAIEILPGTDLSFFYKILNEWSYCNINMAGSNLDISENIIPSLQFSDHIFCPNECIKEFSLYISK